MTSAAISDSQFTPVTSELYAARLSAALQAFVGATKPMSLALFATAAGVNERTARAHYSGQNGATGHDLLTYFKLLGPGFAAHVLALAGLHGALRIEEDMSPGEALREISEGLAALASAYADGRIDHTEAPGVVKELEEAGRAAIAKAADLRRQFGLGE